MLLFLRHKRIIFWSMSLVLMGSWQLPYRERHWPMKINNVDIVTKAI